MIEPQDFEERDAVGSIDRILVNFGLAIIAVLPTLVAVLLMPWKVAPLIEEQDPKGREGVLLGPGVFFLLCTTVVMLMIAVIVPEEAVEVNGAFIGPALALRVAEAVNEGDVWKTLSVIAPIYLLTTIFALVWMPLRLWFGPRFSLAVSLRIALYLTASIVSFIAITSVAIDTVALTMENGRQTAQLLYRYNSIPIVALALHIIFGVNRALFRDAGLVKTAAGSAGQFGLLLAGLMGITAMAFQA
ncbi:hypothetical protein HK107_09505 [Parvularcula sp. ZS-1/3]|uniref:Uncharacterized protein n=1 Tax=Parvularcula mediterranea TaxID=2732508 RepID=A0A7Y3RM77_9PROT|nr:hypothetical protein [Parvularcula mediterranea]NNU16555.1 hypothetical protein [Parvularcula mediterranea]